MQDARGETCGFSVELLIPVSPIVDTALVAPRDGARSSALERTFQLENFVEALAFVNRVGELAEAENHHPDIAIHYNRVTLRWWTHTAGGITDRDRDLAEKTSGLAPALRASSTLSRAPAHEQAL